MTAERKIKEVFVRTIGRYSYPYLTRAMKNKKKIYGKIIGLPEKYIKSRCLVVPITESQAVYFNQRTQGNLRRIKFVESILRNPRNMLDKVGYTYPKHNRIIEVK